MKFSLVTAYYNRRELLLNTLYTISNSIHVNDLEVIIVDDASNDANRIDDVESLFNFSIKVIRINQNDKWWKNPCIPFNIGFNSASGENIIIQNPECLHVGDIIDIVNKKLKKNTYINFGCYSVNNHITNKISKIRLNNSICTASLLNILEPFNNKSTINDGEVGWYNHSKHKPSNLHFCSAIRNDDLRSLGGFDERYSQGIAYDDNEFLLRIKRKGIEIIPTDDPFVVHQYHGTTNYTANLDLVYRNLSLYKTITMNEKEFRVYSRHYPCFD
jgi:GT2 family glycosyltransferase